MASQALVIRLVNICWIWLRSASMMGPGEGKWVAKRTCFGIAARSFGFGKTLNQGRSIGLGSSDPRLKRFGFGLKSRQRGSRIVRQFSLTLAVGHQSFSLRGQVCNPPVKCRAFGAQGGQLMPRFIGSVARGNGTGAQIAHCPHGLCLIGGGGPVGIDLERRELDLLGNDVRAEAQFLLPRNSGTG